MVRTRSQDKKRSETAESLEHNNRETQEETEEEETEEEETEEEDLEEETPVTDHGSVSDTGRLYPKLKDVEPTEIKKKKEKADKTTKKHIHTPVHAGSNGHWCSCSRSLMLIAIVITLLAIGLGLRYNKLDIFSSRSTRLQWFESIDFHVFTSALSYLLTRNSPSKQDASTQTESPWQEFIREFDTKFVPKYNKAVPEISFKVIRSSIAKTFHAISLLDEGHEMPYDHEPSVFLVLGRQDNRNVSCFINDLEKLIEQCLKEEPAVKIRADVLSSTDLFAKDMNSALEGRSRHVVTVDNLNKISGEVFMHLHPYTDHKNARYRDAIIFLVGYTDDVNKLGDKSSMRDMDKLATSFLEQTFIGVLKSEQMDPIITRLTPSVTAVLDYPGTKPVCH